jgi:hypothetical protein
MLPPEITAYGAMSIPTNSVQPTAAPPQVTVDPIVQVTVQSGKDDAYDNAVTRQSTLGGSGDGIGGGDR